MRRLPLREKMIRVGQSKETLEFLDSEGCVVSSPEKTAKIGKDKKNKSKKKPIAKAVKAKRAPSKPLIPRKKPNNPNQNLYTDVM